eukprot:CAMPEP_0197025874 /NCGR_PEP_ID=MMETSP1384-20130603/6081_1 /TAXON_ID=29189 /ORGANISM="Ammonia sp." /LENGTH=158 /DNA_ID=CAMNT_0042454457 /DNA_START=104 /DNA_END=577 /DNA_ORIENTATION=+
MQLFKRLHKPATSVLRQSYQQNLYHYRLFCSMGDGKRKGTVKWFNSEKGFGFIVDEDSGEEVFVHQTAIHAQGFRSLAEGEEVEFDVQVDDRQRKKAHNVTGPDGAFVLGAPRPDSNYGFGGGGMGQQQRGNFFGDDAGSGDRRKENLFGGDDDDNEW